MKKFLIRIVALIGIIVLFSSFFACGRIDNNEYNSESITKSSTTELSPISDVDTTEFKIPLSLVAVSGRSSNVLADELIDGGNCTNVAVNSDNSITVSLTNEQLDYWINSRIKMLEDLDEEFKSINSDYKIVHNEDCTQLSLYYDLDLDAQKAVNYTFQAEFFCGMFQVFTNPEKCDFNIDINIYNCATGKLVTSGELKLEDKHYKQRLSYDETDWKRSE